METEACHDEHLMTRLPFFDTVVSSPLCYETSITLVSFADQVFLDLDAALWWSESFISSKHHKRWKLCG